jgi:glycosyltransferase involved in cell wall biosynthesis
VKIVTVMTTASRGGAEFAAVEMLDALSARGHETVVVTNQPLIGRDTRVQVRPLEIGPKLARGTYAHVALRSPVYLQRLRRALAAEAPFDVLLLHYKKEQLLARWLPPELRPTLTWAEWGPVPVQMRRGLPRRMYLRAARDVALVMAVSAGTKASVCEVGVPAERVEVVPNVLRANEIGFSADGRASTRARLGIPADAFVVGCISRFHPKKRNDVVVEAVARLEGDTTHLILAGDGETEEELRRLAAPLGERVHFVPTPSGDVGDVLSAFDVSVFCPSPTEGAPRAVILAMLAERAAIATGAEGVADIIVPGVGMISSPENDPEALATILRTYAGDPERIAREGAAGRARAVATYDAPVVAEQIERLLTAAGARAGAVGARDA